MDGRPISRRVFLGSTAAVAAGGLLAACGSSGGGSTSSAPPAPMFGGTPRRGGHLRFATWSEVDGMDPTINRWDQTGYAYAATVYDPLAMYDSSGRIVPYLARAIDPNADYTEWTVALRPGVAYHDGSPLDARGVATFMEKMLSSPLTGYAYSDVDNVRIVDSLTLAIALKRSWPVFDAYLAEGQLAYPPSPAFWGNPNRARQPVGTGPFVFREWWANDHFTADRNPRYWRPGRPYLDSVTFRPIPDTNAEESTLKAGGVDAMFVGSTDQMADLRSDPDYFYFDDSHPSVARYNPTIAFLMVNCAKPPLDDIRLRQALAAATDSATIIDVTFNKIGAPINGPFPPGSPYYVADNGYPRYDPNRARALVEQVTAEKGRPVIKLRTVNNPKDLLITQMVQSMWKKAGIGVQLEQVEQARFITDALLGNYDVCTFLLFGGIDFDQQYVWLAKTTISPIGQLSLNFSRYADDQLQAALDAGRSSRDPAVRARAYQTVSRRLGAGVPYVWVTAVPAATASHRNVHEIAGVSLPGGGSGFRAGGAIVPTEMWLS